MLIKRQSGLLLHITSLPGKYGIGTLGSDAYRYVDWLNENHQGVWQILPLGPTDTNNSPYQSFSVFAGNPLLIDPEELVTEGWLKKEEAEKLIVHHKQRIDFKKIAASFRSIHRIAFERFREGKHFLGENYQRFLNEHGWWLEDYALFEACRKNNNHKPWNLWDRKSTKSEKDIPANLQLEFTAEIEFQKFLQFVFFQQYFRLKKYANEKGIRIFGDMPLYVSYNSADVWCNQDLFHLDKNLEPIKVGGVPPDYFSHTGQRWGNPVYNWEKIRERNFDWWMARIHFNLMLYDLVRIDHFRGLESYWAIPKKEKTAINGKWEPALGHEMLTLLKSQIGNLPIIAEDLGLITREVEKLRKDFQLPGMKVLQFAFDGEPQNTHLPHNHTSSFVVYSGTHDNNTTLGWLREMGLEERRVLKAYYPGGKETRLWQIIRAVMASPAKLAILPMQDILELGSSHRMNIPGQADGNWDWRFSWKQLQHHQEETLKELTFLYGRKNRL